MNAPSNLELRMCPECGIAFAPKTTRDVYCCPAHRNAYCRTNPISKTATEPCEVCGTQFIPKYRGHRFCSDQCRYRHRYQLERANPDEIAKNKARSAAWYAAHREEHLARVAARRLANSESAKRKKSEPVPAIEPWLLPCPELDYLPGGFASIQLSNRQVFQHWQLSALHGVMTSLTGPHLPHMPRFALLPWPRGCGWAAYLAEDEAVRALAGREHEIRLGDKMTTIRFGTLVRVKAPRYKPGTYKVRVDAITPVHIRAYGSSMVRITPNSRHLRGTLEGFMPRRLGLNIQPNTVRLELLEGSTSESYVALAGRNREFGRTAGWAGHAIVETNAVGRFLLQCCALGMGYGGKVAFGFGRIRVTEVTR
jgi:hypothetical protein